MRRPDLVSGCARCAAVCCVALAFDAGEEFAFAKAASERCRHLTASLRCAIHAELTGRGMRRCVAFDCFGAGPRATRAHRGPDAERRRVLAFGPLVVLHELLWQLTEAAKLAPHFDRENGGALAREVERLDALAAADLAALLDADLDAIRRRVRTLLRCVGDALHARGEQAVR